MARYNRPNFKYHCIDTIVTKTVASRGPIGKAVALITAILFVMTCLTIQKNVPWNESLFVGFVFVSPYLYAAKPFKVVKETVSTYTDVEFRFFDDSLEVYQCEKENTGVRTTPWIHMNYRDIEKISYNENNAEIHIMGTVHVVNKDYVRRKQLPDNWERSRKASRVIEDVSLEPSNPADAEKVIEYIKDCTHIDVEV